MIPAKTFFIAALCGVAVSALPFDLGNGSFGTSGAYAKNGGNGGGNGNGGGGGNGNGGAQRQIGLSWRAGGEETLALPATHSVGNSKLKSIFGERKEQPPRKSPQGPPQKLRKGRRQSLETAGRRVAGGRACTQGEKPECKTRPTELAQAQRQRLASTPRARNSPPFRHSWLRRRKHDLAQAAADAANAAVNRRADHELDALNAELGALTGLPPAATPEEQAAREAQIAELNAQITEQQALPLPPLKRLPLRRGQRLARPLRTPTRRRSRQRWSRWLTSRSTTT